VSPTAHRSASRRPRRMPTPPTHRSSKPRICQSRLPKYQPAVPPMRRTAAKACAGGASTTTVRVSSFRYAAAALSIALTNAARSGIAWTLNVSRAVGDRTTVAFLNPSTSARPTRACAGVTSASQRPDQRGVRTGTGRSSRCSPRSRAYSRIMSP
jgi:hypothetical protein